MTLSLSFVIMLFLSFKQNTAYEMRISDWSSDVCSSDLGSISRTQCAPIAKNLGLAKQKCIDIRADRRHGTCYEHQFVGTLCAESGPHCSRANMVPIGDHATDQRRRQSSPCGTRRDRKSTRLNSSH